MAYPHPARVRRVAIIGAGTIGASWAAWFLGRGIAVTAYDPAPEGEEFLKRFIADAWPALKRIGLAAGADPSRITFVKDPAKAVEGVDFVQESAYERLELKQELLAKIDAALPAERIIASSTSSMTPQSLAKNLARPERLVVGHPFNPPHMIPLVEVVGGDAAQAAVDWTMAFYKAVGKHPIKLNKAVFGHVANRLQFALWREVVHLVAEGVASVADVDAAIAYGPGLRWAIMGPSLVGHLGSHEGGLKRYLEQFAPVFEAGWAELGNPSFTPEIRDKLVAGVEEEAGGRSLAELGRERDDCLIGILEVLARNRKKPLAEE
ncbi:MAG: 3-hydroxyacyl-CoA dehydrogenase [Proteobacteria bacterium]|nr:3-hydroxyacyl-CoA dehydrogenase [Pseudomonadota bacterium]